MGRGELSLAGMLLKRAPGGDSAGFLPVTAMFGVLIAAPAGRRLENEGSVLDVIGLVLPAGAAMFGALRAPR